MDVDAAEELKKQKEWVVNLWVKRKWADELPKVKPIPGFCKLLLYIKDRNYKFDIRYHASIGFTSSKIVQRAKGTRSIRPTRVGA